MLGEVVYREAADAQIAVFTMCFVCVRYAVGTRDNDLSMLIMVDGSYYCCACAAEVKMSVLELLTYCQRFRWHTIEVMHGLRTAVGGRDIQRCNTINTAYPTPQPSTSTVTVKSFYSVLGSILCCEIIRSINQLIN